MIKPTRLDSGMTIGVIAPASSIRDHEAIDRGIAGLERLGFCVKPGRFLRDKYGFLAAHDRDRLADIHAMFADRKVDAIMCGRGGYGTSRIVDAIDLDLVKKHPKVFTGFSDITMLNLALLRRCNLVSFSGPMLTFTFADDPPHPFTLSGFERTLMSPKPAGSIWQGHPDRNYRVIARGEARGRLVGGNLSLVAASVGTAFEMQSKGRIVFLEEIDEKPYRIDRMLTQLLSSGKLLDAAGIVIGRNVPDAETAELEKAALAKGLPRMVPTPPRRVSVDYEPTTDDVFADRLGNLGIPVLTGLPFGHIKDYATIPQGVMASMSTKTGDLVIEESAVI